MQLTTVIAWIHNKHCALILTERSFKELADMRYKKSTAPVQRRSQNLRKPPRWRD